MDLNQDSIAALLHFDGTNGSTTITDLSRGGLGGLCMGTAAISTVQSKFGGSSLKTGSANGNYLKIGAGKGLDFGSGDLTVESWVWPVSQGTDYGAIFGRWDDATPANQDWLVWRAANGAVNVSVNGAQVLTGAAGDLPTGAFVHVALTRAGTALQIWVGGVAKGSGAISGAINCAQAQFNTLGQSNFTAGSTFLEAYYDDFRATVGVARYTAGFTPPAAAFQDYVDVILLMHAENTQDSSRYRRGATLGATASISAVQKKFGSSAFLFNGTTTSNVTIPHDSSLDMLTGDFTVEHWVYLLGTTSGGRIVDKDGRANTSYPQYCTYEAGGKLGAMVGSGNSTTYLQNLNAGTISIPLNQWVHLAFTRQGTTLRTFVGGVLDQTVTQTGSPTSGGQPLWLGGEFGQVASQFLNGYLDEVLITKGEAKYTTNFTPPTSPASDSVSAARTYSSVSKLYGYTKLPSTPVLGLGTTKLHKGVMGQSDQTWGGRGRIAGQTTVNTTPTPERVRLVEEGGGVVQTTWSDAGGNYVFDNVNENFKYHVIGRDYTKTYNAVVQDNITPVIMPSLAYPSEAIGKYRRKITIPRTVGLGANHAVLLRVGESLITTNPTNGYATQTALMADIMLPLKTFPTASAGASITGKGTFTADINFTTLSGTMLPYWLERVTGTAPNRVAHYWVNLGSQNLDSADAAFYVIYNGATPQTSNTGNAVFPLLFDDFLVTTVDTAKWVGSPNLTNVSASNDVLQVGTGSYREVRSIATFDQGYEVFGFFGNTLMGGGWPYTNSVGQFVGNFGFAGGTQASPQPYGTFVNTGTNTGATFFIGYGDSPLGGGLFYTPRQAATSSRVVVQRGADGNIVGWLNDTLVGSRSGVPAGAVAVCATRAPDAATAYLDYIAVRRFVAGAPAMIIGYEEIAP
ncbi:hypothetical protein LMG31506_00242 [Cupriavidus yeoncheonensis]|uniref:DUF2341 domain-containing protein n=1 Tax=Cupriavidus yeoncheonensis TaxID=1462994 RepID=A0A916IQK1_9BURK|nr:DUF2341 domain-containing protein [Cupriavidus yeoncheonensis]CAG2126927.1 hypothetical protein LMG31506_00242 [Cupriavidus yeoncheonensis]